MILTMSLNFRFKVYHLSIDFSGLNSFKDGSFKFLNIKYFKDFCFKLEWESFVAVCDMLLKFQNVSAKLVCNFNE